jgi:hypothetical protein
LKAENFSSSSLLRVNYELIIEEALENKLAFLLKFLPDIGDFNVAIGVIGSLYE